MPLEPQRVQRCEKTASSERVCLKMCVVCEYLGIKPTQSNGYMIDVKMVCLMDDGSEQQVVIVS